MIDDRLTAGFERSVLSVIASHPDWWNRARPVFSDDFAGHISEQLREVPREAIHRGLGGDLA